MAINIKTRHAAHPDDVKNYDTQKLRDHFLINDIFQEDQMSGVYTAFDRLIVGGIMPKSDDLFLLPTEQLKAEFFLERREIGLINVGQRSSVSVDGITYTLNKKDALYIGRGSKEVTFHPSEEGEALIYYNSAPAHTQYPTKKISIDEAEKVELGSLETSNHRIVNKLIVNSIVKTCQLQMGLTELKPGSIWNTMPAHVHDRRMEAYFYFDLPEDQAVCHYMGEPQETRHIWLKNRQAVISPPWSIHSGAGTSNYSFIWGMAGENLDYGDMDSVSVLNLR